MKNNPWGVSMWNLGCHTMDGGQKPKTGEEKGRREEGKFAWVIFGQGLLPTKGSWNGFRISKCCWQLATLGVRHLRRKALERILPFYTLAYLKGQVIMLTMFEKKNVTSHFGFFSVLINKSFTLWQGAWRKRQNTSVQVCNFILVVI